MNLDEFWKLIETVKSESGPNIEEREVTLRKKLKVLDAKEIIDFEKIFANELLPKSYKYKLWGAAYIMQGGCGDDSFWDFRSSLISMGKEVFEKVLENPDSLADLNNKEIDNLYFEGFQYVARQVFKELTGNEMENIFAKHTNDLGEKWDFDDEEESQKRYPKLFQKFW